MSPTRGHNGTEWSQSWQYLSFLLGIKIALVIRHHEPRGDVKHEKTLSCFMQFYLSNHRECGGLRSSQRLSVQSRKLIIFFVFKQFFTYQKFIGFRTEHSLIFIVVNCFAVTRITVQ